MAMPRTIPVMNKCPYSSVKNEGRTLLCGSYKLGVIEVDFLRGPVKIGSVCVAFE